MADIKSWGDLDLINSSDDHILEEHGLNKSLWIQPLVPDEQEIERQIIYLRENLDNIETATANRRAVQLLGCYSASGKSPPPILTVLFGTLLETTRHQFKYAKKGAALAQAAEYIQHNPYAPDKEVAKYCGVDRTTVNRWRTNNKVPRRQHKKIVQMFRVRTPLRECLNLSCIETTRQVL